MCLISVTDPGFARRGGGADTRGDFAKACNKMKEIVPSPLLDPTEFTN